MNQTGVKSNISLLAIFPIYCAGFFLWVLAPVPLILYVIGYNAVSYIGLLILIATCGAIIVQLFRQPSKLFKALAIPLLIITCPVNCLSIAATAALPTILDKANINGITYYLLEEPEALDVHIYYSLYKCTAWGFQCTPTEFYWGPTTGDINLHLMQDKNNSNEIYVVRPHYYDDASDLMYSDGTQSIHYNYAGLSQLGNHLYYLAYISITDREQMEESRIYMLYQCNPDNTNCLRLPFQYQSDKSFLSIEISETNNEVSIFETKDFDISKVSQQRILVYTYGDEPRCYVADCVITSK